VRGVAFIASSAREYTPAERQRRIQGALPGDKPKKANPGVALGLHPERERDPVLLERLRAMQRRLGPEVRARQAALVRKDGYADLERIACPALVVACRQDRLRRFEETERMARHLPNARFEVLEDCGHMAPLEKPRELAMLLAQWIDGAGL
jgi:pimeloyl-ACP methyl ester carboxylesterase